MKVLPPGKDMLSCWSFPLSRKRLASGRILCLRVGPCKKQSPSRAFLLWSPASLLLAEPARTLLAAPPSWEETGNWKNTARGPPLQRSSYQARCSFSGIWPPHQSLLAGLPSSEEAGWVGQVNLKAAETETGRSSLVGKAAGGDTESRPPLTVNVDSPGPAAYPPPSVTCRETTAPAYTFGWKTPPKEGGGRRSWQKTWFQSKNPFTKKADFNRETNWPSPFHYSQSPDSKPPNRPSSPCYTFGQKGIFSLTSKDAPYEPAPNRYNTSSGYQQVLQRAPTIVISPAPQHTYRWARKEGTPGPGSYNVETGHTARLPSSPSFFIQGVRRPKKHETGPFSTL